MGIIKDKIAVDSVTKAHALLAMVKTSNENQPKKVYAPGPVLTVLSYGAGQDSSALLYKFALDADFRKQYAPNDFLVVMSATGDEFPETDEHVEKTKVFCKEHGIKFVHITNDMGFHTGEWQGLGEFFAAKDAIASKAYRKICSQRLKLDPIYNYLETYISETYGTSCGKKQGFKQFAYTHNKIRMVIGIAAKEEKRTSNAADRPEKWYAASIEHSYPLVEMGMDRQGCQDYIKSVGKEVPIPSNCVMCPWLSIEELEYIRRFLPERLARWVQLEQNKLNKWKHLEAVEVISPKGKVSIKNNNLGVWGTTKYLPEKIEEAKAMFSDWTDERVIEYRNSHGHCVSSTF